MQENKANTKQVEIEFVPWEQQPRVKQPWVVLRHGETIAPPNEQASNNNFENSVVLQPRDEPVEISTAKPLSGRHGTSNGASDEPSGTKRSYITSGSGVETGAL